MNAHGSDQARRCRQLCQRLAMKRNSQDFLFRREPHYFGFHRGDEFAGAANIDIEPELRDREMEIDRLSHRHEHPRKLARDRKRRLELRIEHRAFFDRHDFVRTPDRETEIFLFLAAAGVEHRTGSSLSMCRDRFRHFGLHVRTRKRLADLKTLPCEIGFGLPVLERAAAAKREMPADGLDPVRVRARHDESGQGAPIAVARNFDVLAGQRIGDMHAALRRIRNAVALPADGIDADFLAHTASNSFDFTPPEAASPSGSDARRAALRGCSRARSGDGSASPA